MILIQNVSSLMKRSTVHGATQVICNGVCWWPQPWRSVPVTGSLAHPNIDGLTRNPWDLQLWLLCNAMLRHRYVKTSCWVL